MRQPALVGSIEIEALPATVYRLITDLSSWNRFAVETRVPAGVLPLELVPGATFRAWNRNGLWLWRTTTTVLHAEPMRTLAFEVTCFGRAVSTWRYDIVPTERGSRVTESTRDLRGRAMCLISVAVTGVVDRGTRNQRNIDLTLTRLKAAAEKPA
ncbi:SRPBCC family protein [Streptomyces cavernae]|uniref:SRPBCC family protein n=1 Tax=Streptomyces cavernae TaxID=2259034 RepID=UPI000FEC1DE9|nr:SRPBCC family protein [Streptomyces cavernae]